MLQGQLRDIYIDADVEIVETSLWFNRLNRKEYTLGVNATGNGVDDPDQTFFENFACKSARNYTGYCNKEVDALIAETRVNLDPAKRAAAYDKIAVLIQKERPIVYLFHRHWIWAHSAKLTGLRTVPDGMVRVQGLKMAQ